VRSIRCGNSPHEARGGHVLHWVAITPLLW
jgi:hypothetical protein